MMLMENIYVNKFMLKAYVIKRLLLFCALFLLLMSGALAQTHSLDARFSSFENRSSLTVEAFTVADTVIFKTGYYSSNGSAWVPFTFNGSVFVNSSQWVTSEGSFTLPSALQGSGEHYLATFSCAYEFGVGDLLSPWDCHNGWQLEVINNSAMTNNSSDNETASAFSCLRTFYVSNAGSDSNDGLSVGAPWQSVAQVNAYSFSPGDCILFNRGDVWREELVMPASGNSTHYVSFGAYGVGEKPRLYASENVTSWTETSPGSNVWESSNTFVNPDSGVVPEEVYGGGFNGSVYFEHANGSVSWGSVHKASSLDVTEEFDWAWEDGKIYVYAPENPATSYLSVEVAQRNVGVYFNQQSYLAFDNLAIRYARLAGFKEYWKFSDATWVQGLLISNTHISHISVKGSTEGFGIESYHSNAHFHNNEIHETGRRAMSIYTLNADSPVQMRNVLIENNTIYNSYHTGVDIAANVPTTATIDNVTVRNNFFYEDLTQDSTYGGMTHVSVIGRSGYENILGVMVYNNVMKYATKGGLLIYNAQNVNFYHNTLYGVNPLTDVFTGQMTIQFDSYNCSIKNNFVYNTMNYSYYEYHGFLYMSTGWSNMSIDYNAYYLLDPYNVVANVQGLGGRFYVNSTYTATSNYWDEYQAVTGNDANTLLSITPVHISDAQQNNFSLQASSPEIDAGELISGFHCPTNGTHPGDDCVEWFGIAPDIGAFESSFSAVSEEEFASCSRTFYVANAGSDSNDGVSEDAPWQSVAQVNSYSFTPGDCILFNRGDTWRETITMSASGTSVAYIKFGAYGVGEKPRILGADAATGWTDVGGNIWSANNAFADPYGGSYDGGVFFEELNGSVTWGLYNNNTGTTDLTTEYDWWWNSADGKIYVYSPTNPETRYSSVEIAQRDNGIYLNDKDFLRIRNFDIRYTKLAGIKEAWPFSLEEGLEVSDCHVSHIGIKGSTVGYCMEVWHSNEHIHHNEVHDCGRRGITARTQDADWYTTNNPEVPTPIVLHDVIFEYNIIYNTYHAGISFVSEEATGLFVNSTMRYNVVYEDPTQHIIAPEGYEMGHIGVHGLYEGATDTLENISIHHNIVKGPTGYGIMISSAENIAIYNNVAYGMNANSDWFSSLMYVQKKSSDSAIKNNIFYNNFDHNTYNLRSCLYMESGWENMDIDYNTYYTEDPLTVLTNIQGYGGAFYASEWDDYVLATGLDVHSNVSDPLFLETENFTVQVSSPVIDAGIDVGFPYNGSAPDRGIVESDYGT